MIENSLMIRIVLYFLTSALLFSLALKMYISLRDFPRGQLRSGIMTLAFSLSLFGLLLAEWGISDPLRILNPELNTTLSTISVALSLLVLITMLGFVLKVEKYVSGGKN